MSWSGGEVSGERVYGGRALQLNTPHTKRIIQGNNTMPNIAAQ